MATAKPNMVSDVSTLTRVPNRILESLTDKMNLCIGSAIHDAIANNEQIVIVNIGIGTLSVNLADMQCKFVPSKELKATIKRCISEKVDPLEMQLEEDLYQKVLSLYKEVL